MRSDWNHAQDLAIAAAVQAGAFIRQHTGQVDVGAIREKTVHDLVTYVDEGSERIILDVLRTAFPDDTILAEESAVGGWTPHAGRRWIIDPLDGTTNFLYGVPPYAVSIALEEAGQVVVAVVYEITRGELYTAVRGQGLRYEARAAHVSATPTLDQSLIATGFPFRDFRYVDGYMATAERFMRGTRGLRRHGSAAMDLAWVATGRFDGYFEAGVAPWDIAAGILLVEEGGGRVTGMPGLDGPLATGALIASNGHVHDAMTAFTEPLAAAYGARG